MQKPCARHCFPSDDHEKCIAKNSDFMHWEVSVTAFPDTGGSQPHRNTPIDVTVLKFSAVQKKRNIKEPQCYSTTAALR